MQSSDVFSLLSRLFAPSNTVTLWICLALLFFALALWAQRRSVAARARADRARRDAAREDLGGDSYFMPLPVIEQAVEVASPVEIDSLLNGEPETVAARARAQLTARTDISMAPSPGELPYILGSGPQTVAQARARSGAAAAVPAAAPRAVAAAPATVPLARAAAPAVRPAVPAPVPATIAIELPRQSAPRAPASAAAAAVTQVPARSASAPAAAAAAPAVSAEIAAQEARIPVRDLVLTWFEARGYRAAPVSVQFRPLELELRHRSDADRVYAFVAERDRLTGARASALLKLAKAAGHARLLVAAEGGSDAEGLRLLQESGLRVFDETAIRAELGKIDVRVAAKILGVARSRIRARQSGAAAPSSKAPAAIAARNVPMRPVGAPASA